MANVEILIEKDIGIQFNFRKYINLFLSVIPEWDLVGIITIRIMKTFDDANSIYARYVLAENEKKGLIEINIGSILKNAIPKYLFHYYGEIAALLLSEYVFHEIGHHVHLFKKHGVKKKMHESFSHEYARRFYYQYYVFRKKTILRSYMFASLNVFMFSSKERKMFAKSRKELINWKE